MKYICLFLKSFIYSLSPMPGLKFQNQQNPCGTRKLFSVYPHNKGNISSSSSSHFSCCVAQKLLLRTTLMNGNIDQTFKLSNVYQLLILLPLFLLLILCFLEESYTDSLQGTKTEEFLQQNQNSSCRFMKSKY